jgi:hypothetical protein
VARGESRGVPQAAQFPPELIDRLDASSVRLVLLHEQALDTVARESEALREAVREHRRAFDGGTLPLTNVTQVRRRRLALEHDWFESSFEEFSALLDVVRSNDHGGNRQALGQYGKLLAEAVRLHLREEGLLRPPLTENPTPPSPSKP